jgi:FkbM family methyltransferase
MVMAKKLATRIVRRALAAGTGCAESIPILAGPLRQKRLPRYLALKNIAILFGQYEPAVVSELVALVKQGDIAYDIGAHIGFMTLVLASRVGKQGRVFAFEPVPDNVVNLKSVVLLNRLEHTVSIVPKAVSNTTCLEKMVLRESSSIHILEKIGQQEGVISGCKIDVETTTLDFFLLHKGHPIPNLLKIDVEGSETLVIEGALGLLKRHSPTLLIEVHGPDNAGNLWDLLQEMGYVWWRVTSKGRLPISKRADCISPFSQKSWTHHFLMQKI